jgi:hypothetical protein
MDLRLDGKVALVTGTPAASPHTPSRCEVVTIIAGMTARFLRALEPGGLR